MKGSVNRPLSFVLLPPEVVVIGNCRWLGAALAAGVLALPAWGQERLAWKLKEGDKFYVETVSTFRQTMKLPDKDQKSVEKEISQEIEYTTLLGFRVLKKNADGGAVVEQTVESMKFKNANSVLQTDEKVQGATLTFTLSPRGEVSDFKGYEELLKRIAGEDASMLKALRTVMSQKAVEDWTRELFAFLPASPAKTWERVHEAKLGPLGDLSIKTVYALEGKESVGGKAAEKISLASTVEYKQPAAQESLAVRVLKADLKVEDAKGTIHFDADAGRLVDSAMALKLKGTLTLEVNGVKLEADVQQEQTVKARVLAEKPALK